MAMSRVPVPGDENGSADSVSQPRPRERLKGSGAMRQGERAVGRNAMLFLRAHLAEGAVMAVRPKNRIVAKSGRPSRREDKDPIHSALESFICAIRPGQRQDADESRPPGRGSRARPEFVLDAGHGGAEVLGCAGPSGRINARRPVKRVDAEARIVGERNEPRSLRGGSRLQHGIGAESRSGLLGLLETHRGCAKRREVEGLQQFVELSQLAGVVSGDDETTRKAPTLACASDHAAQRVMTL